MQRPVIAIGGAFDDEAFRLKGKQYDATRHPASHCVIACRSDTGPTTARVDGHSYIKNH